LSARAKQGLWFVALWAGGVLTLGLVAGVLRLMLPH
jgi:hypothetical protein